MSSMNVAFSNDWKVAVNHASLLGEGPLWDPVKGLLLWVDIESGDLHQYSPINKEHKTRNIGHSISAISVTASGGIIAALKNGFAHVDRESNGVEYIQQCELELINNRFNDGKCDPAGRFWAGSMDYISGKEKAGSLYVLNTDLSVSCKIMNVTCSNGLAWSPDHTLFYYIDTPTQQVVAYDYDIVNGEISNKRVIIAIPKDSGYPDGMTIDEEGMLWIALWGGAKVVRYNPFTGDRLFELNLPVSKITSCTFGGDNLQDLYITTAKTGLNECDLELQPHAGSLFVFENIGYKGLKPNQFKG